MSAIVASGAPAIDALLDAAAAAVCRVAEVCVIGVLFDDGKLHPLGVHHVDGEAQAALNAASDLAWEGGISADVLASGEAALLESVDPALLAQESSRLAAVVATTGIRTAIVIPMRVAGHSVGVMGVGRIEARPPFEEAEVPPLQVVADVLGLAVHAMHLEELLHWPDPDDRAGDQVLAKVATLTAREREILQFIGDGLSSREIAEQLFLSVRTVEWHRARLMAKLGVTKRSQLIALQRSLRS